VLRLTALASACFMSYATFAAPPPDHGLEPLPTLPDTFTNGDGTVLSLEGGWPFALGSGDTAEDLTGWRIEPQAQVIWQRVDVDDLVDDIARVRYSDGVSTVGRLGIRLNRIGSGQGRNGGPRASDAWLRLERVARVQRITQDRVLQRNGVCAFYGRARWACVGTGDDDGQGRTGKAGPSPKAQHLVVCANGARGDRRPAKPGYRWTVADQRAQCLAASSESA